MAPTIPILGVRRVTKVGMWVRLVAGARGVPQVGEARCAVGNVRRGFGQERVGLHHQKRGDR